MVFGGAPATGAHWQAVPRAVSEGGERDARTDGEGRDWDEAGSTTEP